MHREDCSKEVNNHPLFPHPPQVVTNSTHPVPVRLSKNYKDFDTTVKATLCVCFATLKRLLLMIYFTWTVIVFVLTK